MLLTEWGDYHQSSLVVWLMCHSASYVDMTGIELDMLN